MFLLPAPAGGELPAWKYAQNSPLEAAVIARLPLSPFVPAGGLRTEKAGIAGWQGCMLPAGGEVRILWYNAENLFHPSDDPFAGDDEFTPGGARHWTWARYRGKLTGLAKVIIAAGEGDPPELVGLCEIENDSVLEDLAGHPILRPYGYRFLHRDSPDHRGMDVALLYREERFRVVEWHVHRSPPGDLLSATRDMVHISGMWGRGLSPEIDRSRDSSGFRGRSVFRGWTGNPVKAGTLPGNGIAGKAGTHRAGGALLRGDGREMGGALLRGDGREMGCALLRGDTRIAGLRGDTLDLFLVHLVSRYSGTGATASYRRDQAALLVRLADSVRTNRRRPLVVLAGDFNDPAGGFSMEPLRRALPGRDSLRDIHLQGWGGSYRYRGVWERIDRFLVTGGQGRYRFVGKILQLPVLLTADEAYGGVKPWRTYTGYSYTGGVSDHLPILLVIRRRVVPVRSGR